MIKAIVIQAPCDRKDSQNDFPSSLTPNVELVGRVHSVSDGIALVRSMRPHLVFLDVDMPGDSAFRVFEETTDVQYEKIILSDKDRHVIKAARYKCADYLLKPLRDEDFLGAVERLLFSQGKLKIQQLYQDIFCKRSQLKLERLFLKTDEGNRMALRVDSIARVEDLGGLRCLTMDVGWKFYTPKSLAKIANALIFNDFFLVNNHLVNLRFIQFVHQGPENTVVVMEDGVHVPVPISLEQSLRRRLDLPASGLLPDIGIV